MKDLKKNIPNILTFTRLLLTPVIIIFGLMDKLKIAITLAIISALTDMVDGKLARKWKVESSFGAKLDIIADKVFFLGLILSFINKIPCLTLPVILETIIGISGIFYFFHCKKSCSIMIGKFKTTFLFITIIVSLINLYTDNLEFLRSGFICATINLQILCIIFYYLKYKDDTNIIIKNGNEKDKKIYDYELDKTKKISNLSELIDEYEKEE